MAKKRVAARAHSVSRRRAKNWGGKREGAGRKAKLRADGSRLHASHAKRERFTNRRPVHVTMAVARSVPSLRKRQLAEVASEAIERSNEDEGFRVVHYSVRAAEVALVCEADDSDVLTRGMRGLSGRLAKAVNGELGRKGPIITERYEARVLHTKAEVASAARDVQRDKGTRLRTRAAIAR